MRILVIGFPLPNPQFDNYNLLTAASWFDYDAIFIDPLSVSTVIEDVLNAREQHQTRADEPVLNRPTSPFAVGLADMVRRRRSEAAQLLANGGTIVALAQPNVIHEGVTGFPGCDRYAWLPAPAGVAYEAPFMTRAEGTEAQVSDSTHPFAGLLDEYARRFAYRVRFDENTPGFPAFGRVVARSIGGAVISVELKVGGGRVLFLPAFGGIAHGDQRFSLATALLESLRRLTQTADGEERPGWVSGIALPRLEELASRAQQAELTLAGAERQLEDAQAELAEVEKYRELLWQQGHHQVDPIVRDAFRLLDFAVESDPERPGWIEADGVRALFEVEVAPGAVTEFPYFRLQKRLQDDLISTHQPKRGLLVINGFNRAEPSSRGAQASDTLRIAAENYRYTVLTTERLFELVRTVLQHPDDAALRATLRGRLLTTVGEVASDIAEPPGAEPETDVLAAES